MNGKIKIILLLSFGLAIVLVFDEFVPYATDEFVGYYLIQCRHYRYNLLVDPQCRSSLNVLNSGLFLPLESPLGYVGTFPSLYYYPLFLIWKSPMSARFMGIIFLLIQAIILSKLFHIKMEYLFLGLISFFPYSFQHIVDTGPVTFQITSIYFIYYLLRKWLRTLDIACPIAISIIVFLGIWTKLTYFWLLPGIGMLFLLSLIENKETSVRKGYLKKLIVQFYISFLFLMSLLSLLFLSSLPNIPDNYPYQYYVFKSDLSARYPLQKLLFNLNAVMNLRLFDNLINPFQATHMIYDAKQPTFLTFIYEVLVYSTVPLSWVLLSMLSKKNSGKYISKSAFLVLIFIITLIFIISMKSSWAMHHAILAFPFLILSFLVVASRLSVASNPLHGFFTSQRLIVLWFLSFLLFNGYFFASFPSQVADTGNYPSTAMVNRILSNEYLSKNHIYAIVDWGIYYFQGLHGSKFQGVRILDPNDPDQMRHLKIVSLMYDRKVLFIYNSLTFNPDSLGKHFSLKPCKLIDENSVWNIMLEEDEDSRNICFQ